MSTYPNPGRATAKYSVATDLWLSLNSIPTVRTSTYGGAAAALMVGGTRIYVVGGTDPTASTGYARSESYMVATDTWVTRTSMPTARKALAVAATTTSLFAVGGDVPGSPAALGTLEMLTFATDVWASRKRALRSFPALARMSQAAAQCHSVQCHASPALARMSREDCAQSLGGTQSCTPDGIFILCVCAFGVCACVCASLCLAGNSMPTARHQCTATVVNGIMYVAAGYPGPTSIGRLVELYSVATDTWATGPHVCTGLGAPLPHLHQDRAHRCHICTGTGAHRCHGS